MSLDAQADQAANLRVEAPPIAASSLPEPAWVTRAADELGWAWVRINWQRAAGQPDTWYDAAKADAVVAQFPKWFQLTILHFAGVEFVLSFWQECIVRLLFGWKRSIEVIDPRTHETSFRWVRLFRELRLWVPRKAGKTEFLAALALMVWYYEGLPGGEGYVFARDENQAGIPFGRMKAMVGASEADMQRTIRAYANRLWCQKLQASFWLITAKAEGKHGRAPYVTIGDEMHEWRSRELADNLRGGEGPYLQPLRLYASTAGLKSQVAGRELFEESQRLLDGRQDDPSVLVAMFAAGDDDDWNDEAVWRKVNPNLGLSPTLDFLRQEYKKAKLNKAAEARFRCYHLNQWVESIQRWIKLPAWDRCAGDAEGWRKWPQEIAAGRECLVSFDSTEVWDFAQLCWRFPPVKPGEKTRLIWKFYLPEETIKQRAVSEGRQADYDFWVKSGLLVPVPGEVFELKFAIHDLRESMKRWKIKLVGYDPFNALSFYTELVNPGTQGVKALPEDIFQKLRFGHLTLAAPTRAFETNVYAGDIEHGGNPIARMMMGHCHVRYDANMNIVPAKKKSAHAIDGVVGAVMTEALSMNKPAQSFWQKS